MSISRQESFASSFHEQSFTSITQVGCFHYRWFFNIYRNKDWTHWLAVLSSSVQLLARGQMSCNMTKLTKWLCAQRRLRSAWASAKSDQSLCCQHEESLGPLLPIEHTAETLIRLGGCLGWAESSLGAHSFCWFCHVAAQIITTWQKLSPYKSDKKPSCYLEALLTCH